MLPGDSPRESDGPWNTLLEIAPGRRGSRGDPQLSMLSSSAIREGEEMMHFCRKSHLIGPILLLHSMCLLQKERIWLTNTAP